MTGPEVLAYIKRVSKRTDKDTETYEAITDTILDMKLRFEHDRFKVEAYSTSLSTVADYKIDLPSDFGHLVGEVRCYENESNARELAKKTKAEFDRLYPNPNDTDVSTGMPKHYCIFGEQILVGPPVDKTTYTAEFSYTTEEVEEIDADTTAVPFSDRYRECLKAGALWRLYEGLEEYENAAYWRLRYEGPSPEVVIGGELGKIIASDRKNTDAPGFVAYNDI